jgi:hypothetical protein
VVLAGAAHLAFGIYQVGRPRYRLTLVKHQRSLIMFLFIWTP